MLVSNKYILGQTFASGLTTGSENAGGHASPCRCWARREILVQVIPSSLPLEPFTALQVAEAGQKRVLFSGDSSAARLQCAVKKHRS